MTFTVLLKYKNVLGAEIRRSELVLAKDIFISAQAPEPIWRACRFDLKQRRLADLYREYVIIRMRESLECRRAQGSALASIAP